MRKQLGPLWCISFTLKSLFQDFATSQRYREIVPIFFQIFFGPTRRKNVLVIDKTFANSRLKTDILIFWDLTIRTLKGWLGGTL